MGPFSALLTRPIGVRASLDRFDYSISGGDGISGREAGVLVRRRASEGSVPRRGRTGVTAPVVGRIATVGTGSMKGRGKPSEGEVIRGGRGLRVVGAGLGTVGGVGCERAKP